MKLTKVFGPEATANEHISGVSAASDKYPPDLWHIVACVKDIPMAVKISLEAADEIHNAISWRYAHIVEVSTPAWVRES
jgi:hypothetical protein